MNIPVEARIKLNKYVPRPSMKGSCNPAYRHGMAGTRIYKIWVGLLSRCYNSKVRIYKYYGGRGIKVCDRWIKFENFYADMGDRPNGLQLDRIDNDKGYSPDNCRWVTPKENNSSNKGTLKDDMPGKRYGKWLVIKRVIHKPDHWYYLCRCDCGLEKIIAGGELRRKKTTKCKPCSFIDKKGWNERSEKLLTRAKSRNNYQTE